jgi:Xaa-Pro aminopeptidase
MRRGLISWSRDEVPQSVLDSRVDKLQQAMRAAHLDAVLAYTSFAQPAPVQWLSHFVPYWSEAVLAVFPHGAPSLLAALTERVHPWIREVSHLGEVISAPRLGEKAGEFLNGKLPSARRIGVIGLESLPWSVAGPLIKTLGGDVLVDASGLYAELRQPADREELQLAQRATALGNAALQAIPATVRHASDVLAAVEAAARLAGAEEVLQRIAPDLARDSTLLRMEGDAALGERFAIELSVAYKGAWVRLTRCVVTNALDSGTSRMPHSWQTAADWVADAAAAFTADSLVPAFDTSTAPGRLTGWTLEACVGVHPLSVIASHDRPPAFALPAGSLAVFAVQLELDDGPWRASMPLLVGAQGGRSRLLDS